MEPKTFEIELLDPTEAPAAEPVALARRLAALDGVTLGLLENSKFNSATLLDYVAEVLQAEYGVREVIRRGKQSASFPAPDAVYDELARAHAVVTGIGD